MTRPKKSTFTRNGTHPDASSFTSEVVDPVLTMHEK